MHQYNQITQQRRLPFCDRDGDYFTVVYESPAIKVRQPVWGCTDCGLLVNLFQSIAEHRRGWKGSKIWQSIEGELELTATSDNLGHIMFTLALREEDGPEAWKAKVQLGVDAAQTEIIAKKLGAFFAS